MPCKKIIVITTYYLGTDDCWDVLKSLILEHSFDIFPALWKACRVFEKLCFFVVFLQLGKLWFHASDVGVRIVKSYFTSEGVPELVQSEKNSCSAYEDLVEKKELTY